MFQLPWLDRPPNLVRLDDGQLAGYHAALQRALGGCYLAMLVAVMLACAPLLLFGLRGETALIFCIVVALAILPVWMAGETQLEAYRVAREQQHRIQR